MRVMCKPGSEGRASHTRTETGLGQSGRVGVVLDHDGSDPRTPAELLGQGKVGPTFNLVRGMHPSPRHVHRPAEPHANPAHVVRRQHHPMQQGADGSFDLVENALGTARRIDAEPLQGRQAAVSTADPELQSLVPPTSIPSSQPSAPAADIGWAQSALAPLSVATFAENRRYRSSISQ